MVYLFITYAESNMMNHPVRITEFEKPSGKVRGVVTAFADLQGKDERRIAHAFLLVDSDPDISLDVPKRLLASEVAVVANGLLEFLATVQGLSGTTVPNDIQAAIAAEEALISSATARVAKLRQQLGPAMTPLDAEDIEEGLMSAEAFYRESDNGCLTGDDGDGVWATETHRSDVRTSQPKPDWATHVLWFNR
jgi:hypothetical protein